MQHIMTRVLTEDFDAWLQVQREFAATRQTYGITDGPIYRDVDNPNAALFHISVEDVPRAREWFESETLREASRRAKVISREVYLAERQ
jgi:hypothetical protein